MKYTQLLTQHNLQTSDLSQKLRKLIEQYTGKEVEIAQARTALEEEENEDLRSALQEAEADLEAMDEQIVQAFNKWFPKRAYFEEQTRKLQEAAAAKKGKKSAQEGGGDGSGSGAAGGPEAGAGSEETSTSDPAPGADDQTTKTVVPGAGIDPSTTPKERTKAPKPEKKKSTVLWVLGGLAALGLAAVGVNAYKNK
jgi:hypothetical protein